VRRLARARRRPPPRVGPDLEPLVIVDRAGLVRLAHRRIAKAVAAARALRPRRRGALSIALVDDRAIRRLHKEHLGLDSATDVLAFPLAGAPGGALGEVVASAETARREASARGHAPAAELLLYVVHGLLHLLGFDDHSVGDRRRMRAAERRALHAAGVSGNLFS
jgi:probable rRNA maturation factor